MSDTKRKCDDRTQLVSTKGLKSLGGRPSVKDYLSDTIRCRAFIIAQGRAQANRQTKGYRLWRLWLVINPFLDVLLYAFLFGYLLKTSRGIPNFVGYVVIGVIFMRMMTGMMLRGSQLLSQSKGLVLGFNIPKSSIVLAQVARHSVENATAGMVGVAVALAFQFPKINWTIVWVVPLFLLLHVFGAGLMFITARVTTFSPELDALLKVLSQAWFFLSGVMYTVERFASNQAIYDFMTRNPAYVFLQAIREAVLYGTTPSLECWGYLVAWSAATFMLGFIYFWGAEHRYAKRV